MMQPNSISGTEEQRQQPDHARKEELLLRSRSKVRKLKRRQRKKKKKEKKNELWITIAYK